MLKDSLTLMELVKVQKIVIIILLVTMFGMALLGMRQQGQILELKEQNNQLVEISEILKNN